MNVLRMPIPRRALLIGAGLLAITSLLVLSFPTGAEADHTPIHARALTTAGHNEFPDDVAVQVRDKPSGRSTAVVNLHDASRMAVFEFRIQPGAWFPWHTHPGPVLAAVVQGDLVFVYADDCVERRYDQGEAFVDPGAVHTAYNPTDQETVVIATVLGVAAGAPPSSAVQGDAAQRLNDDCGTSAPVPSS